MTALTMLRKEAALVDDRVLLDAPASVVASLDRQGKDLADLEVVFISSLRGDATYGLPALLRERVTRGCTTPLWIVGPRGIQAYCMGQLAAAYPDEMAYLSAAARWEEAAEGFSRNRRVAYHAVQRGRTCAYRMLLNGRIVTYAA